MDSDIQSIVVGYLGSNIQKRIGSVVPRENAFVDSCRKPLSYVLVERG
jgi:hypothetical protein